MKNTIKKLTPVALALGTTTAISFANVYSTEVTNLAFTANQLDNGYRVQTTGDGNSNKENKMHKDRKGKEGKCGGEKDNKGKEGKYGGEKDNKGREGKYGAEKDNKSKEGTCANALPPKND